MKAGRPSPLFERGDERGVKALGELGVELVDIFI
jgi:hypothetical protein